jgi:hypothetical protein
MAGGSLRSPCDGSSGGSGGNLRSAVDIQMHEAQHGPRQRTVAAVRGFLAGFCGLSALSALSTFSALSAGGALSFFSFFSSEPGFFSPAFRFTPGAEGGTDPGLACGRCGKSAMVSYASTRLRRLGHHGLAKQADQQVGAAV